jgi:hypothetical protein
VTQLALVNAEGTAAAALAAVAAVAAVTTHAAGTTASPDREPTHVTASPTVAALRTALAAGAARTWREEDMPEPEKACVAA